MPDDKRIRRGHAIRPRETTAPAPAVRSGKKKQSASLEVRREDLSVVPKVDTEENIVRVKTGVDRVMLALILILLALGSVMVFSASYPSALAQEGDSLYYIKRQLVFIAVGVMGMIVLSLFPPGFYRRMAFPVFCAALFLLVIVLIPGIGISNGEARRWLGLKGTPFTFQPSEIMKAALVMMLAWYLDAFQDAVTDRLNRRRRFWWGTFIPCGFVGLACGLVLLEKHLSGFNLYLFSPWWRIGWCCCGNALHSAVRQGVETPHSGCY